MEIDVFKITQRGGAGRFDIYVSTMKAIDLVTQRARTPKHESILFRQPLELSLMEAGKKRGIIELSAAEMSRSFGEKLRLAAT